MCRSLTLFLLFVRMLTLTSVGYAAGSSFVFNDQMLSPISATISQASHTQQDFDRHTAHSQTTDHDTTEAIETTCYEDESCEEFHVACLLLHQWLGEVPLDITNVSPANLPSNFMKPMLRPPIV